MNKPFYIRIILIHFLSITHIYIAHDAAPQFHVHITGASATSCNQNQIKTDLTHTTYLPNQYLNRCQNTGSYIVNNIISNKYIYSAGAIAAYWLYIQYHITAIDTLLENDTAWCNWKATSSLQQLASAPQEELLTDLITDMHKKYLRTSNHIYFHNKQACIYHFIQEICYECSQLEWYLSIKKWTKRLYCKKMFYFAHKKNIITDKIHRLDILLNRFIDWQTQDFLKNC